MSRGSLVGVNVGGQVFATTLETLTKERGSMLEILFSGQYDVDRDTAGNVFIDRDGQRFRHVLNYLRSGTIHLGSDPSALREILEEAEYYGKGPTQAPLPTSEATCSWERCC